MWLSEPGASSSSNMPALPKYSSTQAWKAVPLRADMPGSLGTGRRSRASTAAGSSPRSTNVDAEMWPGRWTSCTVALRKRRSSSRSASFAQLAAKLRSCRGLSPASESAAGSVSGPAAKASRTRPAAASIAARRPGTSLSLAPVRGSAGPSNGSYGHWASSRSWVNGLSAGSDDSSTDAACTTAAVPAAASVRPRVLPSAATVSASPAPIPARGASSERNGDISAIPAREPTQAALETHSTNLARVYAT
ncbi:hypothetical protein D9M72_395060 [compost metagenome]